MTGLAIVLPQGSPQLRQAIEASAEVEVRHYGDRELLFERGDPAEGIYWLRTGLVGLSLTPRAAARLESIEVAEPGALLGMSEVVAGGRFQLTARSAGSVTVTYLRRAGLLALLSKDGSLCSNVLVAMSEKLGEIYDSYRLLGGPQNREISHRIAPNRASF